LVIGFLIVHRFENAVTNAEKAMRLDPYSHKVSILVGHAREVAQARLTRNEIIKACKFSELTLHRAQLLPKLEMLHKIIEEYTNHQK